MSSPSHPQIHWHALLRNNSFRFYFLGIFISLFGTGMNFAGVTLYVLGKTHSTVQVSLTVILLMLPRLVVPPFGGVLTDRVDRRYLGIVLDLLRGIIVLGAAGLAWWGHLQLWQLYSMVLLLGVGFAIYWASSLALLQEIIPPVQLVSGNSAVLIAVQSGMLVAGAVVGFVYESTGLAGILTIDAATYGISVLCFFMLRHGYFHPQASAREISFEPAPPSASRNTKEAQTEREFEAGLLEDIREGLSYLKTQPNVLALGITYACMMAGVISANVLVVALANDLLHVGARGYGFIESGWALGAIAGGVTAGPLARRRPLSILITALFVLAAGHALFPYAGTLIVAVTMNIVFGACRAIGAVLTQSSILASVPGRLMGRTQSAFALLATGMQLVMSFALGWLAEHAGLQIAFLLLGLLYGVAVFAALRLRTLGAFPAQEVPAA